jgi:hypothetical protein
VDDPFWDDTRIPPGEDWLQQIQEAMAAACVAVLLVSADFMASDFINTRELPVLLAAAKQHELKLLPVILKPSSFDKREDTRRVQAVNLPSEPLIEMSELDREKLWDKVARSVQEVLDEQTARQQTTEPARQEPPSSSDAPAAPEAAPISPALPGFQDAAQTFLREQRTHMLAHLRAFRFTDLFIEELGWNRYKKIPSSITVEGQSYTITAIAEKHGFAAYLCYPDPDGPFPERTTRRKIEEAARQLVQEHLFIFIDQRQTQQVWQWVRSRPGHPRVYREIPFVPYQKEEELIRGLPTLAFDLVEEEILTIVPVVERFREVFDVDRVTKRFFDRFKVEHAAFLKAIDGIADEEARAWYTSLMLTRLMFTYFIQKQGFLPRGDEHYLRHRLEEFKRDHPSASFYRQFLLRLFQEGLGQPPSQRAPDTAALLGEVPYLNGGLFEEHAIEKQYPRIQIPNAAFDRVFGFFDDFRWYLDDRPLHNDKEINPDVLGYIFEKYVNQKQMGAYYTKEDITGYISKNTIIPFLFEAARPHCAIAFRPDGEVWRLLRDDPESYFYPAMLVGVKRDLPPDIAAGIKDVARREGWNRPADAAYALPTETWREVVARRQHYEEVRAKLANGEITNINDLITYNLNIQQFALDVIQHCEGPDLLSAFWRAIEKVSVLDPTCGSGAFLFAALNVLEPLYEACLTRMQQFVDEANRVGDKRRHQPFRDVLDQIALHPNRRYFILKSIIVNNLYGVDIMEEAVEIARLRLFLKLVAQIDDPSKIEPLPDIDFNIRAGNTLVGYATYAEVERAVTSKFDWDNALDRIKQKADDLNRQFDLFRGQQTTHGGKIEPADKEELRRRLGELNDELNRYLAIEYNVTPTDSAAFERWRQSHQPFHWFIEFYGIVHKRGGFDVIIGNPPYVEWANVKEYRLIEGLYQTRNCGNLYTTVCERSYNLLSGHGQFGMIVPVSCVATSRMEPLRSIWRRSGLKTHLSLYSGDAHPSVLFQGVKFRLAILLQAKDTHGPAIVSTHFQRWLAEGRDYLFPLIAYTPVDPSFIRLSLIPKVASEVHASILRKLSATKTTIEVSLSTTSNYQVYCHRIVAHFVKAVDFIPFFRNARDGEKKSEDYKVFSTTSAIARDVLTALLNSSLFYCWFVSYSDVYHCGREIILDFPCDLEGLAATFGKELQPIKERLMENLRANSIRRAIPYKATGLVEYDEFYPRLSKPIIDEIDHVLAKHYGFTDEELDFIINYDIKYRLGQNGDEGEDEEE